MSTNFTSQMLSGWVQVQPSGPVLVFPLRQSCWSLHPACVIWYLLPASNMFWVSIFWPAVPPNENPAQQTMKYHIGYCAKHTHQRQTWHSPHDTEWLKKKKLLHIVVFVNYYGWVKPCVKTHIITYYNYKNPAGLIVPLPLVNCWWFNTITWKCSKYLRRCSFMLDIQNNTLRHKR